MRLQDVQWRCPATVLMLGCSGEVVVTTQTVNLQCSITACGYCGYSRNHMYIRHCVRILPSMPVDTTAMFFWLNA